MKEVKAGLKKCHFLGKQATMFVMFFFYLDLVAQIPVEMAENMRADGKIRVVIGVIVIIFLGLTAYLIRLDRRIGKLEDENKDKQ